MNEEQRRPSSETPTSVDPVLETARYVRHVLNAADVGTWHYECHEEEVYFDAPARRILNLGERHVLSLSGAMDLIHPEDRETVRRTFEAALDPASGGHYRIDRRIGTGGDVRWVRTQGRILFDVDGRPKQAFGVVLDVTDQKEMEVESRSLLDANSKLQAEVARGKALEQEVLRAADDERSRIARELHDGLQQHLTGLSLQLGMLERDIRTSPEAALERLDRIVSQVAVAAEQTRMLSRRLMPVTIRDHGLVDALRKLFDDLDAATDVDIHFEAAPEIAVGSDETATHLYRIAQEAANNALKHAKATSIHIAMHREGERGVLKIEDDGVGFDASVDRSMAGIGLRTMVYRADLIAGRLDVESDRHGGTCICCYFPLT